VKKLIGVIIFALSIGSLTAAARPIPFCKDGSLTFLFGAVPSGIYLPGFGGAEPVITFYLYGGAFYGCGRNLKGLGHEFSFKTGPRTDGGPPGDYTHGATFGPGGWFHLYAADDLGGRYFLACGANGIPCTFDAVTKLGQPAWDSLSLTPKQLPNGTYVYEISGTLTGDYNDAPAGFIPGVKAIFSQMTINSANLLFGPNGQQEFGGGVLQVVNHTQ
jgi:hypothetical protein